MKLKFSYLLNLFLFINTCQLYTQVWKIDDGFELEDPNIGSYSDLYNDVEILFDSSGTLIYEDITSNLQIFKKNTTKEGYCSDGVYWIKTTILGSEQEDGKYLFSIGLNIATWPAVGFNMATWPSHFLKMNYLHGLKHI